MANPAAGGLQHLRRDTGESVRIAFEMYESGGSGRALNLLVTPGGQTGILAVREFASSLALASRRRLPHLRVRVLTWDRRNMGGSDVAFRCAPGRSLLDEEAEDLHELLVALDFAPAIIYGVSSGARNALLLARAHPDDCAGLVLWPTGNHSPWVPRFLGEAYYGRYAAAAQESGMQAILDLEDSHYARLAQDGNGQVRSALLDTDPEVFVRCMRDAAQHLLRDTEGPCLGFSPEELRSVTVPCCVLHSGDPDDAIHTLPDAEAVAKLLPGCLGHSCGIASDPTEIMDAIFQFISHLNPLVAKL